MIELKNISVNYGKTEVLNELRLSIEKQIRREKHFCVLLQIRDVEEKNIIFLGFS